MNEEENIEEEIQEPEELYEKLVLIIDKGQEPLRIDKFLMSRIEGATRNKIQQGIDNEMVLVNEKPVKNNYKVKAFDKIVIFDNRSPESSEIVPENIPLNIQYEDDTILIINKPAGMVVHPGSGNPNGTLVNGVAYYLQQQNPGLDETELSRFGRAVIKNNDLIKSFYFIIIFYRLFINQHQFVINSLLNFISGGTFNAAH